MPSYKNNTLVADAVDRRHYQIMIKAIILKAVILTMVLCPSLISKENADIIVSKDGTGQYKNIQDAVNSVPADNKKNVVILIRNGIYNEKIYINRSYIALVGEDRDSTRIVYAELRKNWNKNHNGSDYGSAAINIDSLVTDISFANLTVHNNYGGIYGDHDHQFAIRGGGTRIVIINCNIIADGGDTLSLWNKLDGMYYHSGCYFEGWVDYVCPRGWCFITDSRFYGHNLSASIWHDGETDRKQKLVIRNSSFDGVNNFPLARHHLDGQIYLLDCRFSAAMKDTPIYLPKSSKGPWHWGPRHYFYNCRRDGGDYDWFKDNLETAEGAPGESDITALWTFDGRWDPEETMPAVLPMVSLPRPQNKSALTGKITLKWLPARNAVSHNVYFGKNNPPEFIKNQKDNIFYPGELESGIKYYWRIDEVIGLDTLNGPVWGFSAKR
jgi:pectinesterase